MKAGEGIDCGVAGTTPDSPPAQVREAIICTKNVRVLLSTPNIVHDHVSSTRVGDRGQETRA